MFEVENNIAGSSSAADTAAATGAENAAATAADATEATPEASINEEVEKLRHQATSSLLSRRDVIVVASVSCIYGIGSPQDYAGLAPNVDKSVPLERDDLIKDLIDIQYDRNDYDLQSHNLTP